MYKNGFGNNKLQWLICHKTKPNQIKSIISYSDCNCCKLNSKIDSILIFYTQTQVVSRHYTDLH